MNCVFDCEYCYLKGMYPSANLVVFVNLEDIFAEVEKRLAAHSVYLCVSYDTDLLALEHLTGYAARWIEFVRRVNADGSGCASSLGPREPEAACGRRSGRRQGLSVRLPSRRSR